MGKYHLKRMAAPRSWPLLRKAEKFVTRPTPGRNFDLALPLNHVMKVLLQKGNTTKEVRHILNSTQVLVNGKRVYDQHRIVGFLDVVSFPEIKEHYTISLTAKGKLCAIKLDDKQASNRLVKIINKTRRAGKFQVNCEDGTNITVDKDAYKTGDTLAVSGKTVAKHFPLKEKAPIILTGGKHIGSIGTVSKLEGKMVVFKTEKEELSTEKRHAFVLGVDKAEVSVR